MAARHGTRRGYTDGCRCGDCKDAQRLYQQRYRERSVFKGVTRFESPASIPGPVETGVQAEIGGLATEARPELAQIALALARVMDNPKAVNQQPAAAKVPGRDAGQAALGISERPSRRSGIGSNND